MTPYAAAIEGVFNRHIGRLAGLIAFVDAQPNMASVAAGFPTIAEGLAAVAPGIRALQLDREGRIVATYPPADAPRLLGWDLTSHPRAEVRDDLLRAMHSEQPVITGPAPLRQGGVGLVVRQCVSNLRVGFPDLVTMVLDLEPLLAEADVAALPSSERVVLLDRKGTALMGSLADIRDPVGVSIHTGDGDWTLLAAPARGWNSTISDDLKPTRAATILIAVLLSALTYGIVGREERLRHAVASRTAELLHTSDELRREGEERLQLEERLLQSQKMETLGSLAGGVAHDFNNLLAAIAGFAQLSDQQVVALGDALAGSPESVNVSRLHRDIGEILRTIDRATMLTAQLLAFSRSRRTASSWSNVNDVVRDIERMLQRLVGDRIDVTIAVSEQPLPVMVDDGRVAMIMMNLVANSRDALGDGGTIRITTGSLNGDSTMSGQLVGLPPGKWALVSVADSGEGMSQETVAHMWEPFFTTKNPGVGTGLGLSTVYRVVTQAGGNVFCESTPGEGTVVTIALPLLGEPGEQPVSGPVVLHTTRPGEGKKILVVEDEAALRHLVSDALRGRGYSVRLAEDGMDALDQLSSGFVPDLLVTDLVMPRMGGQELANIIAGRGYQTAVLFMSGCQEADDFAYMGGQSCVRKPFTVDKLVSRIEDVLQHRAGAAAVEHHL